MLLEAPQVSIILVFFLGFMRDVYRTSYLSYGKKS